MAKDGKNSVRDGKLTDEQIGKLDRRKYELIRRINEKTIDYDETSELLQALVEGKHNKSFINVLRGTHKIVAIEQKVDCSGDPRAPEGWQVEKHDRSTKVVFLEKRADGELYINGKKVLRYLSKKQINGKSLVGTELREELSGKKVLNAIILDYLLAHPELIPEEWKKGGTFFWGTIYRNLSDNLCVRYLDWDGTEWDWNDYWLVNPFDDDEQAAVLES